MARLIWLQDGAQLLRSVRLTYRMTQAEFADLLTTEAGWNVTAGVLRAWEDGIATPPGQVVEAARRLARRRTTEFGRRQFLREAGTMAGLTLIGAGRDLMLAGPRGSGRHEHEPTARPITVRGVLHPESLNDLENLVVDYRLSYGHASASDLLGRAAGLVQILLDLQRSAAEPTSRDRLTGLPGEAALLAGLVSLMGPHDLPRARDYYQLALDAALAVDDIDLATYVTGSLSFGDARAGRLADGLERIQAAQALVDERCSPTTRAWLASLASELHARAGDELECKRLLEQADEALDIDARWVTPWKGVGLFDAGKLVAYRGGDLVLLATQARGAAADTSAREAQKFLVDALSQLPPSRHKHRCTALGDLAMALAVQGEVEQACTHAGEALDLAVQLGHAESVGRVRGVHRRLHHWSDHRLVQELGHRLRLAI